MIFKKRALPDFVVIGALRAGTTTLDALLSQVDSICLTAFKESNYFIDQMNFQKGAEWYEDLFSDTSKVCGDISPNYCSCDRFRGVPERIHEVSPNAKIMYVVRDPVARARSHYQQIWSVDKDIPEPEKLIGTAVGDHILDGSRYMKQLNPFLEYFPRENVKVIRFQNLTKDPRGTLMEVCDFLNIAISETELDKAQPQWRNSSRSLAATPQWWKKTADWAKRNDSKLVRKTVDLIPRSLALKVKSVVTPKNESAIQPPDFDDKIKREIAELVKEDAEQFRTWTGMSFEGWSV